MCNIIHTFSNHGTCGSASAGGARVRGFLFKLPGTLTYTAALVPCV